MQCKECQNWRGDPDGWEDKRTGFRRCMAVEAKWNIEDTASAGMEWEADDDSAYAKARDNAIKAARAYVQDASSYSASLYTGPDFFCALFKELDL